jgi:hyperosmotically inducible protein
LRNTLLRLLLCSALLGAGTLAMAQEAPDNSGVNVRDRASGAITAGQQSNSKSDMELTRKIRRSVTKDDSLSMMAHNVKIVSVGGSVTLRGPVETEQEKTIIANKAVAIAGASNVDDQLEVKVEN